MGAADSELENQLRYGADERRQFVHADQPAANTGIPVAEQVQGHGLDERKRLDHDMGRPEQRGRGEQPAAQPRIRIFDDVPAE